MTHSATIRPIDQARAARICLATIDGDLARANLVLAEANDNGAVHTLIATLVQNLVNAMLIPPVSPDQARRVFENAVLDAHRAEDTSHE